MILVEPDQDHIISTDRILSLIDKHAEEIALVMLPGMQYYTGQLFDIARITSHAHSKGLLIGWDLAHAAGNVPLKLHEWNADFAAWCTYKYMNAGPGAIAGLFVHERHGKVEYADGSDQPVYRHRLTGWYSGDQASRFQMDNSKSKTRTFLESEMLTLLLCRVSTHLRSRWLANLQPVRDRLDLPVCLAIRLRGNVDRKAAAEVTEADSLPAAPAAERHLAKR